MFRGNIQPPTISLPILGISTLNLSIKFTKNTSECVSTTSKITYDLFSLDLLSSLNMNNYLYIVEK